MMEGTPSDDDALLNENSNTDINENNSEDIHLSMDIVDLRVVGTDDPLLSPHMHLECTEIVEPTIGMEFDTDEAAKQYYIAYAARVGFGVRMNKSRRSRRDDAVIMRRFVCTREGFHSKRVIYDDGKKKRKRGTTREGCMAMIEVIKKDYGKWVVTKLVMEHTHMVMFPSKVRGNTDNSDASQNDSMLVFGDYSNGGFNSLKNFNRGIRVNPFGEGGEAQDLLEYLKRMQAENPAFFYAVQVDNNNCMTNVFWADAKARMAYTHFGDAVTFDTSYKKTKYMMPFATFRGVNHHLQSVTFGCALLMDETKGSYIWLFETWLAAMGGQHPIVLVTDKDKAMEGAISRIFPNTNHHFCKWHILSRCKQKLSDVYLKHASFNRDFKECINEPETVEEFESHWQSIVSRYGIWENPWLKSLYELRSRWVPVYLKASFYPELSGSRSSESLNKFFKRNFNAKASLLAFVTKFEQAMTSQYEKEIRADNSATYSRPLLKTPSPMEKQAADIYTSAVFEKFQEEFVESLGYYIEKIEDGIISKYTVAKEEGPTKLYIVSFNESDKRVYCSCYKFECSGILCRHVLRVFFMVGIRLLPEEYILKRWTRNATTGSSLSERAIDPSFSIPECLITWYNDLCLDAVKYGIDGATSVEVYKVAKEALQKAFAEVITAKNMQRKGQQNMQRSARMQKMQHKMPLPKLSQKKLVARVNQREEVNQDTNNPQNDAGEGNSALCDHAP